MKYNLCNFVSLDSEEEDLVKKSPKSPKGKQKTSKIKAPPKKDPVLYVSETGELHSSLSYQGHVYMSNTLNGHVNG